MGIRKWFTRKQAAAPFPEEAYAELRAKVYGKFFGEPQGISTEMWPMVPHVDVYIYPPTKAGRTWYTLASNGMSDRPMTLAEGMDRSLARREIILYCNTPDDEYITLVREFAHFPHEKSIWFGSGQIVPNGDPPTPLFENSHLCAVFLLESVVNPDRELGKKVVLDGDPVDFLWLVPITQAEVDYGLENGCRALLDLFDEINHPVVLDPGRASYL